MREHNWDVGALALQQGLHQTPTRIDGNEDGLRVNQRQRAIKIANRVFLDIPEVSNKDDEEIVDTDTKEEDEKHDTGNFKIHLLDEFDEAADDWSK